MLLLIVVFLQHTVIILTNKVGRLDVTSTFADDMTMVVTLQIMKMMNDMIKIPQLNRTMAEMSKEMMKAGMIDEIMEDAIDSE